ncbi:MAG: CCA tRNA nucleotidyltransferase [Minisyncoccia bacterium]
MVFKVPSIIKQFYNQLISNNFQAYLVGGCVRDILLKRKPKDWDIATNALPEEIQKIFPDSVYDNEFGTVRVKTGIDDETLKVIEITTFRKESDYKDKRHPAKLIFTKNIEEDLMRRDFTINALALNLNSKNKKAQLIDLFDGIKDLKNKIIKTVGNPNKRFGEDALRLMRGIRLATELDFSINEETQKAIKKNSGLLKMISMERIRDEFIKIIMTDNAAQGIIMLEDFGLLKFIIPELRNGIGCSQNKHHIYTVFEHNIKALDYAAKKHYSLEVRLASLLHDVGKPNTKHGDGPNATFYNHEIVGAKLSAKILERLKFPKDVIQKVVLLVRYHLFYYNVGEVTEAGVRRFINRVGIENIDDLLKVREADRIGSGVPKALPYRLRHLKFMIDKVRRDPISPKMLKIDGNDIMQILNINPGPAVGYILNILLEEILDDPSKNNKEYLQKKVQQLGELSINDLENLSRQAINKKLEFESGIESEMKKKFYV